MSTVTAHLPAASVAWLQTLIEVNLDSKDGFKEAAANLQPGASSLATLFARVSSERAAQAGELQDLVVGNDQLPQSTGSMAAAAHRMWMDLRTALGGGEQALLEEAERGEDHIRRKYEEALKDLRGCACAATLRRHYAAVKDTHDTIRDLRDQGVYGRSR